MWNILICWFWYRVCNECNGPFYEIRRFLFLKHFLWLVKQLFFQKHDEWDRLSVWKYSNFTSWMLRWENNSSWNSDIGSTYMENRNYKCKTGIAVISQATDNEEKPWTFPAKFLNCMYFWALHAKLKQWIWYNHYKLWRMLSFGMWRYVALHSIRCGGRCLLGYDAMWLFLLEPHSVIS